MSTVCITSTGFARHQPATTSRRRARMRRLALMLARDEQVRSRPPVTLSGLPRADDAGTPTKVSGTWPAAAVSSLPTPTLRVRANGEIGWRADRFEKAQERAFEPGDEQNGNWTREQLVEMNAQFCRRLTWAIGRGLEQAEASHS